MRTVGHRAAAEPVPLDNALEALALGGAGHRDFVAGGEHVRLELGTDLDALNRVAPELDNFALRLDPGFLVLAHDGLGGPLLLAGPKSQARRDVPVLLLGAQAQHEAGTGLQDGDGHDDAGVVEHLRHTQLAGDQTFQRGPPEPRATRVTA